MEKIAGELGLERGRPVLSPVLSQFFPRPLRIDFFPHYLGAWNRLLEIRFCKPSFGEQAFWNNPFDDHGKKREDPGNEVAPRRHTHTYRHRAKTIVISDDYDVIA